MSKKIRSALLLAAGLGTRLKPFTEVLPKALTPVMGVPVLQFAIDSLKKAKAVDHALVNLHHHPEQMRNALTVLDWGQVRWGVSDETQLLLGSAGGLAKGATEFKKLEEKRSNEPFFFINSDVITDLDLSQLERKHFELKEKHGVQMTLTVFPGNPTQGAYREIVFDTKTELMTELRDPPRVGVNYFMGTGVIEPSLLEGIDIQSPSEFIPKILLPALMKKKVGIFYSKGLWKDIGSPKLWAQAHWELMRSLEDGTINETLQERLLTQNKRLSAGIWSKNDLPESMINSIKSPCYFSLPNLSMSEVSLLKSFGEIGPSLIWYQDQFEGFSIKSDFTDRIIMNQHTVNLIG